MRFDIVPEPTGEERAAIIAALEKARSQSDHRDDWWRAGVRENLGGIGGTSLDGTALSFRQALLLEEGSGESLSPPGE